MLKKKKNLIIISLAICCVILIAVTIFQKVQGTNLTKQLEDESVKYPEIYDSINSITFESFKEKIENNEVFTVYVGRPTCSDCSKFEPELINIMEETDTKNKILYLNTAKLHLNKNSWNDFKETYGIEYTPTIAKISHGKVQEKVNWTPEEGTDLNKFKKFIESL